MVGLFYFIIFVCLHFFHLTEIIRSVELYIALQISTVNTDKWNSMLLPNIAIQYYLRFTGAYFEELKRSLQMGIQ